MVPRQQSEAADPAAPRLPSALADFAEFAHQLQERRPVLFLDYDGTLTPIVARPHLAVLAQDVRNTLTALGDQWPVAIVSGRDRTDVQRLVGIDSLIYAGSHGFDILGPGVSSEHGAAFVADLDNVERQLRQALASIDGVLLERKRYSVAVHVRGLSPDTAGNVESVVDAVLSRRGRLRKGRGKMVFELLPRLDWNKGKAVLQILESLRPGEADNFPIYIGDDRTDEDAFMVLSQRGVGILVAEAPRETAAKYTLREPREVNLFLRRLLNTNARTARPL